MKKKYIGIVFWVYVVALFIVSVIPWSTKSKVEIGDLEFRLDYWLHFGAYFGAAFLLLFWKMGLLVKRKLNVILFYFGLCIIYGGVTELIQIVVPSRKFNPNDLLANTMGVLFCFVLYLVFKNVLKKYYFKLVKY